MNMTMTYDGTMVMPKNFAVVTEDEMTYVDGGAKKYIGTISPSWCNTLAAAACIVGGLFTALCGLATIVSAVATICSLGSTAAVTAIIGGITCVVGGLTAAISGYLWLASTRNGLNVYCDDKTRIVTTSIKW